jgi:hypothetical protein
MLTHAPSFGCRRIVADEKPKEVQMAKGKVLVLGSNATQIEVQGGYGPTGQYLNETVVPVMALIAAGYEVVLATPKGTKPTIDAASDAPAHFENDVHP